jgi:signal transduction histidine kinase
VPVDLSQLARDVANEIQTSNDIEFVIEPGLTGIGDSVLLRFVLQNLFENAQKFSPNGGTVRFGGQDGEFFVADEGIGFDMQYADKIFRPFERLHRSEDIPGTGIGLANVERIVRRHGGKVWADSEIGHGATFHFTLSTQPGPQV